MAEELRNFSYQRTVANEGATLTGDEIGPASSSASYSRLPPVDGGRQAYSFLAASFVLEGLVWGLPFSFGVFQVYYNSHEPFSSNGTGVAAIGSTATGIAYFSSAIFSIAMQRWPRCRRPAMLFGLVVTAISLVAASFANSVSGLIATQGVVYGLGSILLYLPANLFLGEWFIARKSLAFGIMWAGTGCAGIVVPFIIEWLLNTYGFRTALRVWAVVMTIMSAPCLLFVKPRLPVTAASALRPQDLSYVKGLPFWIFQFGNTAFSLGMFLPSLWMPSYALAIGLPSYAGPLSLALYNGAYSFGGVLLGYVVDHTAHVSVAIAISAVGSMLAAFVFWGLANSQAMLYCFALLWGTSAGGFNATWPGSALAISKANASNNVDTGIFIGLMAAGRGIGSVVSGPMSERLLQLGSDLQGHFAYGTTYGALVIFCGISATCGGAACLGRMLKLL